MSGREETKKVFCNWCKCETNHSLRARFTWFRNTDDNTSVDLADLAKNLPSVCKHQNSIWTCAGCDTVVFEWQLMYPSVDDMEKWEDHDGGLFSTRSAAKLFQKLKPELHQLYMEVVACLDKDCLLLCTIGLRALIEGVCVDKGLTDKGTGKDLGAKIDGLIKFLPSLNLIEALRALKVTGDGAAHRLQPLTRDDARKAIEVMEDLLNFLYDLDYKASQLPKDPKRAALKSAEPGTVQ